MIGVIAGDASRHRFVVSSKKAVKKEKEKKKCRCLCTVANPPITANGRTIPHHRNIPPARTLHQTNPASVVNAVFRLNGARPDLLEGNSWRVREYGEVSSSMVCVPSVSEWGLRLQDGLAGHRDVRDKSADCLEDTLQLSRFIVDLRSTLGTQVRMTTISTRRFLEERY